MLTPFVFENKLVKLVVNQSRESNPAEPPLFKFIQFKGHDIPNGTLLLNSKDQTPEYMLWLHHALGRTRTYFGFRINGEVTVSTPIKGLHPVTKLETKTLVDSPAPIPCVKHIVDFVSDRNYRVQSNKFYFAQEIDQKSKISGRDIVSVFNQNGIYVVEVS